MGDLWLFLDGGGVSFFIPPLPGRDNFLTFWGDAATTFHKTSRKYDKKACFLFGTVNLMCFIGVTGLAGSLVRGVLAGYQAVYYCTDNLGAFANLLGNPTIISFE